MSLNQESLHQMMIARHPEYSKVRGLHVVGTLAKVRAWTWGNLADMLYLRL
jgi:hypothetical protein